MSKDAGPLGPLLDNFWGANRPDRFSGAKGEQFF